MSDDLRELHVRVRVEDGSMWATVDEVPGVFATGDNLDELRESIEEGIALVLERADGAIPTVSIGEFTPEPVETIATTGLELEYA